MLRLPDERYPLLIDYTQQLPITEKDVVSAANLFETMKQIASQSNMTSVYLDSGIVLKKKPTAGVRARKLFEFISGTNGQQENVYIDSRLMPAGYRYRLDLNTISEISLGRSPGLKVVNSENLAVGTLCIMPYDQDLPAFDMATQIYLLAKYDETVLWKVGNWLAFLFTKDVNPKQTFKDLNHLISLNAENAALYSRFGRA